MYTPELPTIGQCNFSHFPATLVRMVAESYAPNRLVLHDGDVNAVAIVDEQISIKAPGHDDSFARDAFIRELKAYHLLKDLDFSPILTPKLVKFSSDPAFLVTTYVPGKAASNYEVKILSPPTRIALGRDIGKYIARQTFAVNLSLAQKLLPPGAPYTLANEFDVYLRDFGHPAYPMLGRLANTLYERWYKWHVEEPDAFIHGDLQPMNLTLDEHAVLQGIFDFGRATTGKISEELSAFCAVDPVLFESCARQLEAEGLDVNRGQVLLWREMRDLVVLPYWISRDEINNPYYRKFRERTVARYHQFDWRELYLGE